jgi:PKD repeat protein
VAVPVTVASDGSFAAVLPLFATSGTYTVEITAIDANGNISTSTRSLVYDPAPPVLTVVDPTPSSIKISSTNGIVIARDKNGFISTLTNGTSALDLSGATYDPPSLNIYALTSAGISSRNGDINGDGTVDISDALIAMQISLGIAPAATFGQLLHGDVGPLINHTPVPDGKIRLDDSILILQKSIGIDW